MLRLGVKQESRDFSSHSAHGFEFEAKVERFGGSRLRGFTLISDFREDVS